MTLATGAIHPPSTSHTCYFALITAHWSPTGRTISSVTGISLRSHEHERPLSGTQVSHIPAYAFSDIAQHAVTQIVWEFLQGGSRTARMAQIGKRSVFSQQLTMLFSLTGQSTTNFSENAHCAHVEVRVTLRAAAFVKNSRTVRHAVFRFSIPFLPSYFIFLDISAIFIEPMWTSLSFYE